uniref:Family with sequence similarity 170 member A n=1 Tax=Myotis lucifugus TaxID=59463 RepID=G1Q339_MYOLU
GPCKTQQDVPQSFMEAPGCSQAAGENASSSEYFTCFSSPSKLPRLNEDATSKNIPRYVPEYNTTPQVHTYNPTSSFPHSYNHVNASVHGTDRRVMKIYYMHVQLKRGVAALCETEEGWEPPSKKTKMEEMTYIEEVHKDVPLSHMPGKNLLIDPEPSVDSRAQGEGKKADCSPRPPNLGGYRRVPLWKVLHRGFRCMACCHVFPSLALLQEHVENGIREGFSCHVFHRAMA